MVEIDSMLRDELLRSKNDEIAYVKIFSDRFILFSVRLRVDLSLTVNFRRCLSSRKRKLSELYFATVGCATESATGDPIYQQKEQAFLDANDLTKYVLTMIVFDLPMYKLCINIYANIYLYVH